jgi:7-keto-8-aminopelargonate synthetase-like enzyme
MSHYHTTQQLPGRTVRFDSPTETYLWFSGTDYLGMGHNEAFKAYLQEGIAQYGTHFGSSRNNTLRLAVYEEAEQLLAEWVGAKAALTVASGMWAGQLFMKVLETVLLPETSAAATFHYAPRVHPALWGSTYHPASETWKHWAEVTRERIASSPTDSVHIVCTDSVASPWVEVYDFQEWLPVSERHRVWLVVDDSHGLGVLGADGKGIYQTLARAHPPERLVVVASLNKALGIPGGVVLAAPALLDSIRLSPWFSGSSPSSPAYLYALGELIRSGAYGRAHTQLGVLTRQFAQQIQPLGLFEYFPDYPAFGSKDVGLHHFLKAQRVLTACFAYPTPTDPQLLRLVVSALHRPEDLDRVAELCQRYRNTESSKSNPSQ